MTIRAITAVLTIAGSTLVLTGCNEAERQGTTSLLSSLNINDPVGKLSSPAPAVAYVTEVVEEVPEPPAKVWKCWDEYRRAGTMRVEICDWFAP
jgi:hypothetical protein